MKKSYSKPGFGGKGGGGGGKRFGSGSKPWERGSSSEGPRSMHSATCSECGQSCEVPFKPNGKKPIFCSNCFRKDDYDAAPKRSFGESGSFRGERSEGPSREGASNSVINDQLKVINSKLDAIIRALDV